MTTRIKKYWLIATAAVFGILAIGGTFAPVVAHTVEKGDIMIIHPWVEPSDGKDSYAHPTISNEGDRPIVLTRIETPVAGKVEMLRNGKTITNLAIRGGDIVAFDSPDAQIKLGQLTRPLVEGEHFPARLMFTRNVTVDLEMVVGQDTMLPELNVSDADEEVHDDDHDHEDGDEH